MSLSSHRPDVERIWSDFLATASTLVNEQTFRTWFAPLRLAELEGSRVRIECPTRFFMDWVSEHHEEKIRYALREAIGVEPDLEFSFDGNGAGRMAAQIDSIRRVEAPPPARAPRPAINEGDTLNPKYTFEEFVVGNNSRMTYAACQAVSERLAQVYNPLFIYGGVGLGKTHLMQAIGHVVLRTQPGARVHYSSAESFMNEMIRAIREGKGHEFRTRFRNVDLLLIDDIQFLAGKESTQEEFFHTFNALHGANRQIVVTSDRPPRDIPTLEDRLVSRFEWGLITDIQPPDFETRLAILRKKVEKENVDLPPDVLEFIATNVRNNIRELEGSLVKLLVHASVYQKDITVEMASEVLQDFVRVRQRRVSMATIQKVVAQHYGVGVDEMISSVRTARVALPRQVAIYLSRELTGASLNQIGERFGGRDHTTVLHACRKIGRMLEEGDVTMRSSVQQLRKELTGS